MGDLCVTIAKLTKLTRGLPPDEQLLDGFREMGERAEQMIRVALDSLRDRDQARAESLIDLDELIDRANRRVVKHLLDDRRDGGAARVGAADAARLALPRADRRPRRRHRRADRLPRHRRVPRVHRRIALSSPLRHPHVHRRSAHMQARLRRPCAADTDLQKGRTTDEEGNCTVARGARACWGSRSSPAGPMRRPRRRPPAPSSGTGATFPFPLISKWIPEVD